MYDPKFSVKKMYDQYGRSRSTPASRSASAGKQAAASMRSVGIGGLGGRTTTSAAQRIQDSFRDMRESSRTSGGTSVVAQDNNPNRDELENKSALQKLKEKTINLFESFGAEEPEALIVDNKRVYQGPLFRGYDPTTRIGDFGGEYGKQQYLFGQESLGILGPGIKTTRSPTPPFLPPSTINMFGVNTDNPRLNMFGVNRGSTQPPNMADLSVSPEAPANMDPLTRSLSQAMLPTPSEPTAPYTIRAGDTLSEIAEMTGTTVEELAEINNIEKVDEIDAGAVIDIPIRRKPSGLGAKPRPEVTVTELDNYVAAEDTTRTSDDISAPDYATMSFGEEGRPDSSGVMARPKLRPGSKISEKKLIQRTLNDLGYNAGAVDGDIGKGTQRAIRKFQKQHGLEPTGIVDPKTYDAIVSGESDAYPDPVQNIPTSEIESITSDVGDFEIMKKALAKIESGPHGYSVYKFDVKNDDGKIIHKAGDLLYGGANNHYLGKYQMGKAALSDVGVGYSKAEREAFLKDPVAQDKAFKKFTENNHIKLTRESERYRNMTKEEKLGVLGYAHNQGATAAIEWLFTGVSGADANGTKGTKYTTKIAEAFADPNAAAVREFYEVTP